MMPEWKDTARDRPDGVRSSKGYDAAQLEVEGNKGVHRRFEETGLEGNH
jgi:hypothetical protein